MIKYYCDWCNAEIEDDGFISDRLVEMAAMLGGQPYFTPFENKKKRDKYLLCDKCISRIATLKKHITENLRYYDD